MVLAEEEVANSGETQEKNVFLVLSYVRRFSNLKSHTFAKYIFNWRRTVKFPGPQIDLTLERIARFLAFCQALFETKRIGKAMINFDGWLLMGNTELC